MNVSLLLSNLTNPALLLFLSGIIAILLKSDLQIPESSARFISLCLLFFTVFKGGQENAHSSFKAEVVFSLLLDPVAVTLILLTFLRFIANYLFSMLVETVLASPLQSNKFFIT